MENNKMNASPTTFNFLRHGQVDGPSALYGKTDVSISDQGLHAMQTQMQKTSKVDVIISSPRLRCLHFAKVFAEFLSVPLVIEDDLQECDFGLYDGIPFDELSEQWLELNAFWQEPMHNTLPNAESLERFHQRVIHCWQRLTTKHQGQNCLVVSHGGVIRQILADVLSANWQQGDWYAKLQIGYASLTRISIADYEQAVPVVNFIAKPPFNENAP
jgi:alpha-ribazole phosphatase